MVRGMVVTQQQAHSLAIPIVFRPQPQLLLRMIERFEKDIRTALTKRLTKANGITEKKAWAEWKGLATMEGLRDRGILV
jgi:hypothetical protein